MEGSNAQKAGLMNINPRAGHEAPYASDIEEQARAQQRIHNARYFKVKHALYFENYTIGYAMERFLYIAHL